MIVIEHMYFDGDTVLTEEDTRVVLRLDQYGADIALDMILDNDGQVPFVMCPYHKGQRTDLFKGVDAGLAEHIQEAYSRFRSAHGGAYMYMPHNEVFERWARVFYGVNAYVEDSTGDSQGDLAYIVMWPSAEWLETVGLDNSYTPSRDDITEVEGYLWGHIYGLHVERHDEEYDVWYEVGSSHLIIGGTPGHYVYEMAQESLRTFND